MPVIHCPSCESELRIKNDALGTKIRCPECGKSFRAQDDGEAVEVVSTGRQREHSRPAPRSRSLLSSCFLGCGGLIFAVVALVVVVFQVIGWQERSALNKATALYDQGKHDEAVPLYKKGYGAAGDQKAAVLTRIVEYELSKGQPGGGEEVGQARRG